MRKIFYTAGRLSRLVVMGRVMNNDTRMRSLISRHTAQRILITVLLVLFLYVLLPQIGDLRSTTGLLSHPQTSWVTLALLFTLLTYPLGAGTYCFLAFRRMRYGLTVMVQLAAMFFNRFLPGGLGAVGANYAYLRSQKHSKVQAGTVVAINNALGATGHWIIVGVTLLLAAPGTALPRHDGIRQWLWAALGCTGVITVIAAIYGRQRAVSALADLRSQLVRYRRQWWRLLFGLTTSAALTLSNVFCLWCCAFAMHMSLPFAPILLIFTFAVGTGTLTPTPGGLGGYEAGLAGGFIAYGQLHAAALAAALLYRLVSYWFPLVIGGPAALFCQRRHLFRAPND